MIWSFSFGILLTALFFLFLFFFHLKNFSEQITVFRNIASHYNMSFLEETIDWLLVMSPHIGQNAHWMWHLPSNTPSAAYQDDVCLTMVDGVSSGRWFEECVHCRYVWSLDYVIIKLCEFQILTVNKYFSKCFNCQPECLYCSVVCCKYKQPECDLPRGPSLISSHTSS